MAFRSINVSGVIFFPLPFQEKNCLIAGYVGTSEYTSRATGIITPTTASHFASKNHQGGLTDNPDKSDGKMFDVPNSKGCPVKTLESFLKHLNPNLQALFQRPREVSTKFQPQKDEVWYCNSPVGKSTLKNMMKNMSTSAGIASSSSN